MWRRLRETIWLVPTGSQQERWNINLIDVLASSLVLMSEHYLLTSEEHDLFSDDLDLRSSREHHAVIIYIYIYIYENRKLDSLQTIENYISSID
jgi:hypothetical protein